VTDDSPPADLLSQLGRLYPSQLYDAGVVPPATNGFAMNMNVPPFNDVRVRRALNYAVDRNKLVRKAGGPQLNQVSCQILPPGFPGYHPYCRYTLNQSPSGKWSAPDPQRAQHLVAASGTRTIPITIWTIDGFPAKPEARYLRSVLKKVLHYRVVRVRIPHGYVARDGHHVSAVDNYFNHVQTPKTSATIQISFYAWGADYPAPSEFLVFLFACASVPSGVNTSHFCNPVVRQEMNTARAIQVNDPAAANAAWAGVDRSIVDLAPWLQLPTPRLVYFVSARTGNVQVNPVWGLLLSQLWIR
jgi:peptide/nickel transport system substrate-binding protein